MPEHKRVPTACLPCPRLGWSHYRANARFLVSSAGKVMVTWGSKFVRSVWSPPPGEPTASQGGGHRWSRFPLGLAGPPVPQGRLGTLGTAGDSFCSAAAGSMRATSSRRTGPLRRRRTLPCVCWRRDAGDHHSPSQGRGSEWSVVPDIRRNEIMGDAVSALSGAFHEPP